MWLTAINFVTPRKKLVNTMSSYLALTRKTLELDFSSTKNFLGILCTDLTSVLLGDSEYLCY